MTNLCSMCEELPATTTYGLPVCQICYDGLVALDGELKAMEADDPELARLGAKVEASVRKFLREQA